MSVDFKSAEELLTICKESGLPISGVMLRRESELSERPEQEIRDRMTRALMIMRESAQEALGKPVRSMGGLIGGEARKLTAHREGSGAVCGDIVSRAMSYAMGVLEVNASMGLIVAAPTAGSSGVVPGVLLALADEYGFSDEKLLDGLFNAGAIGYLAMRNACVAGAVGGCQAEIGVAAAMAASAAVELLSGSPEQCADAASVVLMNMLGLVCDPVRGLVEYPCQNRNASGAANALVAAEMALSGIRQLIPFDEMLETMYTVGKGLPAALRETALGGCAVAPSACAGCRGCLPDV